MNRIRTARKAKGITMKELGKLVGVSESAISMYETFKREPDNATLLSISSALGVSVDYLLGNSNSSESNEIQPAPGGDELDRHLVALLTDLDPSEVQRVLDFVEGMKAARKA